MDLTVERANIGDLPALASLAAETQERPESNLTNFGEDATAIATEIAAVQDWAEATQVARRGSTVVGWLLAETDDDLARVWWWGPVVGPGEVWDDVADALYDAAGDALDARFVQEELAGDRRHVRLAAFATRHGFAADEPSVLLRLQVSETSSDPRVGPLAADDHRAVAALHDELFPGTHTTGAQLVGKTDGVQLVLRDGPDVVGYVAVEVLADGIGYIDFIGVDPQRRQMGAGRALVATALDVLRRQGIGVVDLTVRVGNVAARRLYRGLGFDELRILCPYRKGFTLDP